MTAGTYREEGLEQVADRDATTCFLPEDEIRKLSRDLRILIACNGTLTRTLGIVANDDIDLQIVEQEFHDETPCMPNGDNIKSSQILQRRIFLKGRRSGHAFVAAESLIAIDLLPPAITKSLTETGRPIGEIMATSCLETFKEAAEVWIGQPPEWLALAGYHTAEPRIVGRRYRVISGGHPAIIITEYFLRHVFHNAR